MLPLVAHRKAFDDFFAAIAPFESAYTDATFTYFAVRRDDQFVIVRGFIRLAFESLNAPSNHFVTANVRAGAYRFSELNISVRDLAESLLCGTIKTPHGDLLFAADESGNYAANYFPLFSETEYQSRYRVLRLFGGSCPSIQQPDLDWELKASDPPYHGVGELLTDYFWGGLPFEPTARLEIIAFNLAAVDGQNSNISGEHAIIRVRLPKTLVRDKVRLGYRVVSQGRALRRGSFTGEAIAWTEGPIFESGEAALDIPAVTFLDCTVSYEGVAQHFWFLFDPAKVQNPRRAAYEVADKNVELIKKILTEAVRKGDEARDFEAAIAWLFWMMGFSVVQLGHTKRSNQAAADLILTSPSDNFAVVECTTGPLKADQKLSLLHERAQSVRRSLNDMQFNHLHVLPVIVTSKPRAEVEPDIEQAEKLGILVLAREAIDELLNRTVTLPNADQLFNEALQVVQAAKAKYAQVGSLLVPESQ
jgi:hypothetical protein